MRGRTFIDFRKLAPNFQTPLMSTTNASRRLRSIQNSLVSSEPQTLHNPTNLRMSSSSSFQQLPHNLLVIPGPIEVTDEVLLANAHPSVSHMSKDFGKTFGDCIRMFRQVLFTKDAQPFIVSGSGTMGWDMVAANLLGPGEHALVINSGYFGDSFADCLACYSSPEQVTQIFPSKVGDRPTAKELEEELSKKKYKLVCFTHVDTSSAVLSDAKEIAETVKKVSPESLVVLDGVCSVGGEEIKMDDWGIDIVLTAPQKALSLPPGLSLTCVSQRALKVALEDTRKSGRGYYVDWRRWYPIHKAYEDGAAAYFATPPVQLIYALHASLSNIVAEGAEGLETRFRKHKAESERFKNEIRNLGLTQVPVDKTKESSTITAVYAPEGVEASAIVAKMLSKGVVIAAGLHKDIKTKYFRIGHMGTSVLEPNRPDLDKIISSLKESLQECGYQSP